MAGQHRDWITPGQTMFMTRGPFRGCAGRVVEVRVPARVTLLIEIEQHFVRVEIDSEWLVPKSSIQKAASQDPGFQKDTAS